MATETQTTRTEHPHIVMTPGYCGGRPRIDGTRLSVEFIVKQIATGDTPIDIADSYPDGYVTAAAVYDALSYYYDHKDEIDTAIEEHSLEKAIERGEIEIGEHGKVIFKKPPASA
jgi:uncharacterized protein (DUF433 family)